MKSDNIFNKIANALLGDYERVFYVDAQTDEFREFSADGVNDPLQTQQKENDFFSSMANYAQQSVYEQDRQVFIQSVQKDNMLSKIKSGCMQSIR